MKRTLRPILSFLLTLAMLLPLYPGARAAVTQATSLRLTSSGSTLYFQQGAGSAVTLTATAVPADYAGSILWSLSGSTALLQSSAAFNQNLPYANNRSITVYPSGYAAAGASRSGTVTVSATVRGPNNAAVTRSYTLTILDGNVSSISLSLSKTALAVGETAQGSVTAAYAGVSGSSAVASSDVLFTTSNANVAGVNSSGVVTGRAAGQATITASYNGVSSSVTVTVNGGAVNNASTITETVPLGEKYAMRRVYSELYARFIASYSSGGSAITLSDTASMYLSIPSGSETYGLLRDSADRVVESGDAYYFTELEKMYLEPTAEGDYAFDCAVNDGSRSLRVRVILRVTTPTRYIRVSVNSSSDYTFSGADTSGKTGAAILSEALGSYGSLRFGSILSGENVGTLYTSPQPESANRVGNRTVVLAADAGKLYFTPSRAGTYRIEYTAYSNTEARGNPIGSGELIIAVDAASSDITVNLSNLDPYTFSSRDSSSGDSASTLLTNAINDAIGSSAWSYLRLTPPGAANQIGTLHESSSTRREIAASDYIHYRDIGRIYFVPSRAGTYELTYGAYYDNNSETPLTTGRLKLVVSTVPTGTADITFTTTVDGKLSFSEDDFISFFRERRSSYYLSCVVFNDCTGGGTFRHDGATFIPYNSADYYTQSFTGKQSANPRYLNKITFTAPSVSGYTVVKFTCYGGVNTDSVNVSQTGLLYIFYTASTVPVIRYDAFDTELVYLREADFASAYRIATNSSQASPKFTVRILTLPASGVLYRNPNNTNGYGSRLSSSDLTTAFTVGSNSSSYSVDTLRYSALSTAAGSESLVYIAYDNDGSQLYAGSIRFKLTRDRVISVGPEGYSFQLSDFYTSESNPVMSVTFQTPKTGKLFVANGSRWVEAKETDRFYTNSTTSGAYPVTSLRYVPRSGSTDAVDLSYTALRSSGASYDNSMSMQFSGRSASSRFGDVKGVTGWAANSIDFAAGLGLVGGIGASQFGPALTMKRCDLVLILYRLAGEPAVSGSVPYTDVSNGVYYYNSALWASQNGIMDGVASNNAYRPTGDITRGDFAQILYNYTKYSGGNLANTGDLSRYSDRDKVTANTIIGVTWAVGRGLITSTSAGYTIEPTRTATRAEIVTLLHRYLTY